MGATAEEILHCQKMAHWGGWRHSCASRCTGRAGGALYVHSPLAPPIVLPSKDVSSVSDHPSNGWERPKQAGWEFRV